MIDIKEIVKLSKPEEEVDKRIKYLMTKNPAITSIKEVADNTQLDITHVCDFTDVDKDGNTVAIESYMDTNGNVYATQSVTFKEYFSDIRAIFDGDDVSIIKKSGNTKAGRDFVYCTLA